ncbi:SGNH/GDSL hydrolase family protein [Chitinophaga alhagiae]|uniref:SGNH/GDSL hydrolase family protein n=1 Tax=Chitinophaga alhagiae TaxID=2203219 RepID=UPI000E5A745F|nr:SGNH/GDSL hydrolase family protein [Chitinophaga alhagiae]
MSNKWIMSSLVVMMAAGPAAAQQDLIAASQAGASPLYFEPAAGTPLVTPGTFYNARECTPRNGLPAFFKKAAAEEPLLVGFIGGSITQGNAGYRPQTLRYLQAMFPAVNIRALNAGVSGTGTDLGASRVREQLLQHGPDLVFVEFAVNGAYAPGMEGIVRQVKKSGADVCLIYTITGPQTKIYAAGQVPENIQGLEKVAAHYGVPSIHLGMEAAMLEQQGRLLWKGAAGDTTGHLLFSTDGVHPLTAGGNVYAAAIARGLEKMRKRAEQGTRPPATVDNRKQAEHGTPPAVAAGSGKPAKARLSQPAGGEKETLPPPLFPDNWEAAGMYAPRSIATFSGRWEQVTLPQFAPWFPVIEKAVTPGAACTFRFTGSGFGIFDVGGPEAGQITITVNGKTMQVQPPLVPGTQVYRLVEGDSLPVNRFNSYCNNRYRGQHQFFTLPEGRYTVSIRLSSQRADKAAILGPKQQEDIRQHPEKYSQGVLHLGRILVKGTPVLNGKE